LEGNGQAGRGGVIPSDYIGELNGFGTLFGTSVPDSPTGISGPVPVGHISTQRRNGRVVGYSVCLGADGEHIVAGSQSTERIEQRFRGGK